MLSLNESSAPSVAVVLGPQRAAQWLERAKYRWRMQTSTRARQRFLLALNHSPCWSEMFGREPGLHYVPLRSFLDKSFSCKERYEACTQDLATAWEVWGDALAGRLARGDSLVLCEHNGFTVTLMRNRVCPHEGLWALQLTAPDGSGMFNLTFGLTSRADCLVASVQGLQRGSPQSLATIRLFTKGAHGLRPHAFLLACLQTCCVAWGVAALWGIDTERQVKRRRNADKQGFVFDYREFWASQGGLQAGRTANWRLPALPARRHESDIPSNKRAEYRRRYVLMDMLLAQVVSCVSEVTSDRHSPSGICPSM